MMAAVLVDVTVGRKVASTAVNWAAQMVVPRVVVLVALLDVESVVRSVDSTVFVKVGMLVVG